MSRSILGLPKWAQDIISTQRDRAERSERQAKILADKTEKQSGDIQALLDIVRALSPEIFDKWNNGTSLNELRESAVLQAGKSKVSVT